MLASECFGVVLISYIHTRTHRRHYRSTSLPSPCPSVSLTAAALIIRRSLSGPLSPLRRAHNQSAPISRLPTELVVDIFDIVVHASFSIHYRQTSIIRRRLVLASVCQRWQQVVHDTPRLWSQIEYGYGHHPVFINRAQGFKLSIHIDFMIAPNQPFLPAEFVTGIAQRSSQWDKLWMQSTSTHAPDLSFLSDLPLPSLSSLEFLVHGANRSAALSVPTAQNLEILNLLNVRLTAMPLGFSLRILSLITVTVPSTAAFRSFLRSHPRLVQLTVDVSFIDPTVEDSERPITFSNLTSLWVAQTSSTTDWFLLHDIDAPHLECITIDDRATRGAVPHYLLDTLVRQSGTASLIASVIRRRWTIGGGTGSVELDWYGNTWDMKILVDSTRRSDVLMTRVYDASAAVQLMALSGLDGVDPLIPIQVRAAVIKQTSDGWYANSGLSVLVPLLAPRLTKLTLRCDDLHDLPFLEAFVGCLLSPPFQTTEIALLEIVVYVVQRSELFNSPPYLLLYRIRLALVPLQNLFVVPFQFAPQHPSRVVLYRV